MKNQGFTSFTSRTNPPLGVAWSGNPRVTVTPIIMQSSKVWRRRKWQPTPVSLPAKLHGQRSLVGCSPRGRKESDMPERLRTHSQVWMGCEMSDITEPRSSLWIALSPFNHYFVKCSFPQERRKKEGRKEEKEGRKESILRRSKV